MKRYAILIGNSRYPNAPALGDLRCPEQDVRDLAEILKDPNLGQFGDNVAVLTDRPSHEVENAIHDVLDEADKDDLVVIYFSGHGKRDHAGNLWLATWNTRVDRLLTSAVEVRRLRALVNLKPHRRVVLILDCCYAGAAGEGLRNSVEDELQQVAETQGGRGFYILAASGATQTAKEKEADANGLYTKHLVAGIRTGQADKDRDGWISVDDLHGYVSEQVRDERPEQQPRKWGMDTDEPLIIAKSRLMPREQRAEKVRDKLLDLARAHYIGDDVLDDGRRIARTRHERLDGCQRLRDALLDRLLQGKLKPADFLREWYQADRMLDSESDPEPVPRSPSDRKDPPSLGTFRDPLKDGGEGPAMVMIPAGEFLMGSPESEEGRYDDERQHPVSIERPFAIGKYAVTFNEYDRFAKATNRELPNDQGWGRGNRPVINVSWRDAVAYANWLSEQTGQHYRLPTEAEWEYAARAGTTAPFHTGACINTDQANYDGNYDYNDCGAKTGVYWQQTVPVGSLPANPWGLHEVHGNVWEWTCSAWDANYGGAEQRCDAEAERRAVRGGSWYYFPAGVRSAFRLGDTPDNRTVDLGFRLARSP